MQTEIAPTTSAVTEAGRNPRSRYRKDIPAAIRSELLPLEQKDNWHNLLFLGSDWLIIVLTAALVLHLGMQPLFYIPAIIIIASRQRALMNLVHEASHNKLFRNRRLNDWLCKLCCAYPLGTGLSAYRAEHAIHHGFLWSEERDAKAQKYLRLGYLPPPTSYRQILGLHLLRPHVLIHMLRNMLSFLTQLGERRGETLTRAAFWLCALAIILLTHSSAIFLYFWVIPYCTVYQLIHYLNEIADHAGLQTEDAWQATRNWTSFFLVCWLIAPHSDDLYHLTHHLFPLIPHYSLAKAHRTLMQVPEYAQAHHCNGFFLPRSSGAPSVLQDILHLRQATTN